MKKILFFAIGLFMAGSVSAQYYTPRPRYTGNYSNGSDFYEPKVGLDIGVNVANTTSAYNSNFNTGTLAGLYAGLTFDIPLIYPLSFAPAAIYSQKGYTAVTNNGNFTQRKQFIDLPLLAKFNVGPILRLYIGPQYSFLLSTRNTYDNGFVVTNQQYYNNTGSKAILDGVLGVGFDLSRYVELRARYTLDLQSTGSVNSVYQPNYRNQVWQFGLNFKF
ncbi:MAG TPA: porin family protein [Mucilaginibacter sp.]